METITQKEEFNVEDLESLKVGDIIQCGDLYNDPEGIKTVDKRGHLLGVFVAGKTIRSAGLWFRNPHEDTTKAREFDNTAPLQEEVNRLRRLLHKIADSPPHQFMDIEKNPELVDWICQTCEDARRGAYPNNN